MTEKNDPLRLDKIEDQAREYAAANAATLRLADDLKAAIAAICGAHVGKIKEAAGVAAVEREALMELLKDAADLFAAPRRSLTVDGVRVGWKKERGKVVITDEAATVQRILDRLPASQSELLVRTTQKVHKPGVYDLTAADLKRLGIKIEDDADAPFIKDVEVPIDKLVAGLMDEFQDRNQ